MQELLVLAQRNGKPETYKRVTEARALAIRLAFDNTPCKFAFYQLGTGKRIRYGVEVLRWE